MACLQTGSTGPEAVAKRVASSEFDLIARIRARVAARRDVVLGIGDDAAVLRTAPGHELVVTMDTLVAGHHFPHATAPRDIGWKALAVNLSDLAAMGAAPAWITLALTLPRNDVEWLDAFIGGFLALARRHGVALVGGDTTRGPLSITVAAHGLLPRGTALRRDGARAGDAIYASGSLGDAAAGLRVARGGLAAAPAAAARTLRTRLDRPEPRVALGLALRGVASAAIDVSDGLAQDLGHVLRASGVGAVLEVDALPASHALRAAVAGTSARRRLQLAGGDDYELCFTVPPRREPRLAAIARRLRLPLTRIGTVLPTPGLALLDARAHPVRLPRAGYDHFA
ncbi:MAG: thiamine-phosphate kinase [Burkholderiales bacterium]|nr:thiamine-phosphate kinase [Burkholderiales bacterium]